MCITFFYLNQQQQNIKKTKFFNNLEFLLAFNRDQQIQRETKPLNSFQEDPNIYAGRDMHTKGTWLGINIKTGIMAILTNYFQVVHRSGKSRGKVVYEILSTNFVKSHQLQDASDIDEVIFKFLKDIVQNSMGYSALNLIVYNIFTKKMQYICTQIEMKQPVVLKNGQPHCLCNCQIQHLIPKMRFGLDKFKMRIEDVFPKLEDQSELFAQMQKIMKDKTEFKDAIWPQSSIFVSPYFNQVYKVNRMTRTTTYICIQRQSNHPDCFKLKMKQITYDNELNQSKKQYQIQMSKPIFVNQFLKLK